MRMREKIKTDINFINKHRESCEKKVLEYYSDFNKDFDYVEPKFSYKTKFNSENDSRYTIIETEGNLIKVFSGKIDTIFEAEEKINKKLAKNIENFIQLNQDQRKMLGLNGKKYVLQNFNKKKIMNNLIKNIINL